MRALCIVEREELIEIDLHFIDSFVELRASLDPEMLVEQGAMHPLDIAVALGPTDLGGPVFDVFQLEEEFKGVLVGPAAVLPSVVGKDGLDLYIVLLEERQHEVVEGLDGGYRDLAGEEATPCVAGVAIEHGLHVNPADAFERADREGVHTDQLASEIGLDMAIPVFGVESFQKPDLVLGKFDEGLLMGFLEPQESLMAGQHVMPRPDAADASRAHLVALEHKVLCDANWSVRWLLEAVVQDEVLELLREPIGMGALGPGYLVEESLRPIGLEVAADLVELLP